jgi:hypothetical protein
MFRLIAAAVAINDERGGTLCEWPSKRIDASDGQRNRLHDPRTATLPQFFVLVRDRFRHYFRRFVGKIAALLVHGHRRRS